MPVTILDAGIAIPRIPRPSDKVETLSNDCHDTATGRFCETGGGYVPDFDAPDEGEFIFPPYDNPKDPHGFLAPQPIWRQNHKRLVVDALYAWKGDPVNFQIHASDALKGADKPSSGSGKQMRAQAEALLWEIHHKGRLNTKTLYRGAETPPKGIEGWSELKGVAASFQKKGRDARLFTIPKGKAKGIRIEDYIHSEMTRAEREWIIDHSTLTASATQCGDEDDSPVLDEFANPCHSPDDGRFCETHGRGGGTALLERTKRSKKVEPATKAVHSNDVEATLRAIPADQFEGQDYVDALQTPQFSLTTLSRGEDMLLKQVRHAQGFDTLPQVVDQNTFDKVPGQAFFRGVGGPRNSNYSEQYRSGDHYAGMGVFANGDYFTTSAATAKGYAEGYPSSHTIQAKLRPGARIISFEEISEVHDQAREHHVWPLRDNPATATQLLKAHRQYEDLGVFAAALGYDAIRVDSPKIGSEKYFVILNRGAVVVSEEDLN